MRFASALQRTDRLVRVCALICSNIHLKSSKCLIWRRFQLLLYIDRTITAERKHKNPCNTYTHMTESKRIQTRTKYPNWVTARRHIVRNLLQRLILSSHSRLHEQECESAGEKKMNKQLIFHLKHHEIPITMTAIQWARVVHFGLHFYCISRYFFFRIVVVWATERLLLYQRPIFVAWILSNVDYAVYFM